MTALEHGDLGALLERPEVVAVMAALDGDGEQARIVGGAVRNALLGEAVADIDIATTCLPQETMRRAAAAGLKAVPTGLDHGTVTLIAGGTGVEVTTLREDRETNGRHAVVAFGRDFATDALRRDFTINALGLDRQGQLHDYADGLADLARRRVRFIGDPAQRIAEDHLRILRFFRFHARYGRGEPDRAGLEACIAGRAGLGLLSRERVRAEFLKLLMAPGAAAVTATMAASGLLMPVIGGVPHLSRLAAVAEGEGGAVLPTFRLAALALAKREDAHRLRERLRLSNAEGAHLDGLAAALEALSGRAALPTVADLRRVALGPGPEAVAGALVLLAARADSAWQAAVQALIAELGRTPCFLLGGRDVLAAGVPAGPAVGAALAQARLRWIAAGAPAGAEAQRAFLQAEPADAPRAHSGRAEEPGSG